MPNTNSAPVVQCITDIEIVDLRNEINTLENRLTETQQNYRLLYDGSANLSNQISGQISAASYHLGLFSIFFTICAVFLGLYLTYIFNRIRKIKIEVYRTKKFIDGHSEDLYKRLERADTLSRLNRLVEVPEDIAHLESLLLSRDLLQEDFSILHRIFNNLDTVTPSVDARVYDSYMTVLTQHFPYECFKDIEIRSFLLPRAAHFIRGMFLRDINYFIKGIIKFVGEVNINSDIGRSVVIAVFVHLYRSRHQAQVLDTIKKELTKNSISYPDFLQVALHDNTEPVYEQWLRS